MTASAGKRFAFAKRDRLRNNAEFQNVFDNGLRLRGRIVLMYAVENGLGRSRLGLAVGKKAGNSVKRNRIRRVLRDVFRLNRHVLSPGFDIVMVAGRHWRDCSRSDVEPEIVRFFEKLTPRSTT